MPTLSNDVKNVVICDVRKTSKNVVDKPFKNGYFYESVGGVFYSVEPEEEKRRPFPVFDLVDKKGEVTVTS